MADNSEEDSRSFGDRSIDAATAAVNAASDRVDDVANHLHQKIRAAKQPETYVEILKDATKAAPLAMLAVAFVTGMLFARRR